MSALRLLLVFLVLSALVSSVFVFGVRASSEDVAASAISRAEDAVALAYEDVLRAEGSDANVSSLLTRLNQAGELLAQAHNSYRLEDFDDAARFADLCGRIGEEVRVEAHDLKSLAVEEAGQRFRWTVIGSILGVAIVVGASFLGWRVFKRRYYRRVLGMKPEVGSDDEA